MGAILNDLLPWDGSFLGIFDPSIVIQHWITDKIKYYGLWINLETIPILGERSVAPNQFNKLQPPVTTMSVTTNRPVEGWVYGIMIATEDRLPCILDAIKPLFGINRRGIHQLQIGSRRYLIYYVPVTLDRAVIWETPVTRLGPRHPLRQDPDFRLAVQRLIACCDILGLSQTGESVFWIRPGIKTSYVPINTNDKITTILKADIYDYSILTKVLITNWFGEDLPIDQVVKEMLHYKSPGMLRIPLMPSDDLVTLTSKLRNQINQIIMTFDSNYIWYANFVIDRLSRYLLYE